MVDIEIVLKEDMKNNKMLYVRKDDIKTVATKGDYRNKLISHIENFKKRINDSKVIGKDGKKEIVISLREIRNILGEGYQTYDEKTDHAIISRIRNIFLECGIKVSQEHHFGAKLIMSFADEDDIISDKDLTRSRYEKTARRKGFTSAESYQRSLPSHLKRIKIGVMEDNKNCSLYLGGYIKKKYLSGLFPGAIQNISFGHGQGERGWDWMYSSNGIKIKEYSSCIRVRDDRRGYIGEIFKWNIKENDEADIFILIGWKDRESLELLHTWIFHKNDMVNGRRFCDRQSFAINNHKWSLNKYRKWEVDINDGNFEELKKRIESIRKTVII